MSREIERKFLFTGDISTLWKEQRIVSIIAIRQGYLTNHSDSLVLRVRHCFKEIFSSDYSYETEKFGVITIKKDDGMGEGLLELETKIPSLDAKRMLDHVTGTIIIKTRYTTTDGYEIDIFDDNLKGLSWVEKEVSSMNEELDLPNFCGREITGIKGMSNFELAMMPETVIKKFKQL